MHETEGRKHFEPERGEIITDFVTYFSRMITLTGLSSHRALRATTRKKRAFYSILFLTPSRDGDATIIRSFAEHPASN